MGNSIVGSNTVDTRDHFWNVDANLDGRHRFIQSPAFTVGGNPDNPAIGTSMDAVLYAKTTNGRVEWFHRNISGIYQAVPSVKIGTVVISSSSNYTNITTVPANVYGEIFMYTTALGANSAQTGFFRSNGTTVESWALYLGPENQSATLNLKFGNAGQASGLNVRARCSEASTGQTWNYIITYRAL